mmetsp:Transcript_246/g.800  ORF Transcript_246/g.800 Transcript_246/m.800 type:complete len:211 (+) Transcript_246:1148-1780(+)
MTSVTPSKPAFPRKRRFSHLRQAPSEPEPADKIADLAHRKKEEFERTPTEALREHFATMKCNLRESPICFSSVKERDKGEFSSRANTQLPHNSEVSPLEHSTRATSSSQFFSRDNEDSSLSHSTPTSVSQKSIVESTRGEQQSEVHSSTQPGESTSANPNVRDRFEDRILCTNPTRIWKRRLSDNTERKARSALLHIQQLKEVEKLRTGR